MKDAHVDLVYFWFERILISFEHLAFFIIFIHFLLSVSHVTIILLSKVLRIKTQVFFYLPLFFLSLPDDLFIRLSPFGLQSFKAITFNSLLCNVKDFVFSLDDLVYSLVERYLVLLTVRVVLFTGRYQ